MNQNIYNRLKELNLIDGEIPSSELESPWYIKLLLSISGWFGALFLLVFVGSSFGILFHNVFTDAVIVLIPVGLGMIYFSYKMFLHEQSDFLEHFYLAISVAGQALVIWSLVILSGWHEWVMIYLFASLFQAFLMWFIPNYIHRMMSSFFLSLSLFMVFQEVGILHLYASVMTLVVVWLYLNEFYFEDIKKLQAIAYGQLVGLICIKGSLFAQRHMLDFYFDKQLIKMDIFPIFLMLIDVIIMAYIIWKILEQKQKLGDTMILCLSILAVVILAIVSLKVPNLLFGIMLLLVGFSVSHKLLIGLGIISSLFFISFYYYYLGDNLMDKAIVLAIVGVSLLSIRYALKHIIPTEVQDV